MITIKQRPQLHVILDKSFRCLFFLAGFLAPIVSYIESPPTLLPWYEITAMLILAAAFSSLSGYIFFLFADKITGLLKGYYQIKTKGNSVQIHEKGKMLKVKPYVIHLETIDSIIYYRRRNMVEFKGKEYLRNKLYCNRENAQKLFNYLEKYQPGIKEKFETI